MQDIYESHENYTFIDDISQFSEKYIIDKFYKPMFKEGDLTIRPYDEVLAELKKHIPADLVFDDRTVIAGGFLLKLICKQFNLDDYPNTDIDIFTSNYTPVRKYFENIENSNKIYGNGNISEFEIKDYKYKFQIIKSDIDANWLIQTIRRNISIYAPIIERFDFGHNEVYFTNNKFYGSTRFINFIKYQVSECIEPKPERIIKAYAYNLRIVSKQECFDFYPDIFEKVEINKGESNYFTMSKYKIKFDKIIPEEHLTNNGFIKGGIALTDIDKEYYCSDAHVKIINYIKNHCNEKINPLEIVKFV